MTRGRARRPCAAPSSGPTTRAPAARDRAAPARPRTRTRPRVPAPASRRTASPTRMLPDEAAAHSRCASITGVPEKSSPAHVTSPAPTPMRSSSANRTAASLAVDRPLHLDGAGEGGAGRGKRGQQAVAERLDPDSAVRGQHIAQHAVVQGAHQRRRRRRRAARASAPSPQGRRRGSSPSRGGAPTSGRRLARRPAEQRGIVGEDRLLQALELGSGMQAELGVERPDRLTVGVQRLALAARRDRARA